eukprot:scaffold114396_cov36-Phaeocystis_antarctica.AAC.1
MSPPLATSDSVQRTPEACLPTFALRPYTRFVRDAPSCRAWVGWKYDNDSDARRRGTHELTNAQRLWVRCTMIAITTENSALRRAVEASRALPCARSRVSRHLFAPLYATPGVSHGSGLAGPGGTL